MTLNLKTYIQWIHPHSFSLEKPKGLLKKTAELDYGASFRYDSNQNLYLGNWLGVIDVNPKHPEILAIADLNMKSVVIYNTTDGMCAYKITLLQYD